MTKTENADSQREEPIAGLDPLDAEHGPARALSAGQAAALADHLARHFHQPRRVARGGRLPRLLLLAAGVSTAAAAARYGSEWFSGEGSPPASTELLVASAGGPPDAPSPEDRPADVPPAALRDHATKGDFSVIEQHSPVAADHLARANALRGERHYRDALASYLHVVAQYPNSLQARAAQLAAAAISLEQLGDVDAAERLYRAVRSSDADLSAEAEFGLAEVLRARGDRPAEQHALREFMARHASHPLAAAAGRRMKALESP